MPIDLKISKTEEISKIESDFSKHPDLPTHYSLNMNEDFFNEAYSSAENISNINEKIYGGIAPHHLFVKDKIASYFNLISGEDYKKVIFLAPNHFNAGKGDVVISKSRWETPFGYLEPDFDFISKLEVSDLIEIDEAPFSNEHSVSGLVGFIRKSLGEVKFTPIILKQGISKDALDSLVALMEKNIDEENTLVLSSVDFSHYQPVQAAEFHDMHSNAMINDFNLERVLGIEVDSPPSVYVLLRYLQSIGAEKSELIYHTNSGLIIEQDDEPSTTHNFYVFQKGENAKIDSVNFLFFGDLMLDRYVRNRISAKGLDYLIDDLAGEEKRFFSGIDIVSANLEGAVTDGGKHYPPEKTNDFAFEPESVKALEGYGFNFFNLSNNHFFDQGNAGLTETRDFLDDNGFFYSGSHLREINEDVYSIIPAGSKKIAMLGLNITAGMFDLDEARGLVEKLEKEADMTIVNIHWGVEYSGKQNQTQIDLAHSLIDAGVDLIIGHHPHVVQGIEEYEGRLIFYSLGNFIFDQYFSKETQAGLAVGVDFSKDTKAYVFPLQSALSKMSLMKDEAKNDFLQELALKSDIDDQQKETLKKGFISINN